MEKEVSLYHQLVEHPIIVLLVGSHLLMLLLFVFAFWWHRGDRREEGTMKTKTTGDDSKPLAEVQLGM